MPSVVPQNPKIYHIVHVDRLASIVASKGLLCDAVMANHADVGTNIGLENIKNRRLTEYTLQSHPDLHVGQCVPFYFCPRSVMLYMYHMNNHPDLTYKGGQGPIVHLEADLHEVVNWANQNKKKWAFTLSNAGSSYFEDRAELEKLNELDWQVIAANIWSGKQDKKQAEFLIEHSFPWELVSRVGVKSHDVYSQVNKILRDAEHKPHSEINPNWYY